MTTRYSSFKSESRASTLPSGAAFSSEQRRPTFSHGRLKSGGAPEMRSRNDYNVGWICALSIEMAAASAMLDSVHGSLPGSSGDSNTYILGSIGMNNIVIASLPSGHYGTNNAATVANNMKRSFPRISTRLMVGIGGGAPGKVDIRLGDVAVSEAVIQHDFGKVVGQGYLQRTGRLIRPPQDLLTAITKLRADHELSPSLIPRILEEMLQKTPSMAKYLRHAGLVDQLYQSDYEHASSGETCEHCDADMAIPRAARISSEPRIHYGLIASGNQVIKHGSTRDRLAEELGVLCFEMEAAGLMDSFPCLVIRGICDYCDSHKHKEWQEYAAAAAAAYAKELLSVLPANGGSESMNDDVDMDHAGERRHSSPFALSTRFSHTAEPINHDMLQFKLEFQESILRILEFDRLDARRSAIKKNYSKTCDWLLRHEDYLDWLDVGQASDHHGFLWIRGKVGVGKSTIMNYIVSQWEDRADIVTLCFFFNARGDQMERSTQGVYRALLVQLLEAVPTLRDIFHEQKYFNQLGRIQRKFQDDPGSAVWPLELLQSLFQSALQRIGDQHVMLFVDALDECDDDDVAEMVNFFEDVGENAVGSDTDLKICFSSRHYPHIDIEHGRKITVEAQKGHSEDIHTFVQNKLRIGKSKVAEDIKSRVSQKSSGIFMWVVLVVQILNSEYKDGRIFEVRDRLNTLPTELSDVFRQILQRDNRNLDDFRLCIQWILFARRPLRLEEFYFAAVSGIRPGQLSAWDEDEISKDDMARYVLSSSRGLAYTTQSKFATVQFIHESVREFFLGDGICDLWPNTSQAAFESISHERLSHCCYAYFHVTLPSCEKTSHAKHREFLPSSDHCPILSNLHKYPFYDYALMQCLYHANQASRERPQVEFLAMFPTEVWIKKHQSITPADSSYRDSTNLLYILADRNLPALIETLLKLGARTNIYGGKFGYPLFAALVSGFRESVEALLHCRSNPDVAEDVCQIVYPNPTQTNSHTPLTWAAAYGYERITAILKATPGFGSEASENGRTALSWAAGNGHAKLVKQILNADGGINTGDDRGHTPLIWAIVGGRMKVVKILLKANGIDVNAKDHRGRTALTFAAIKGYSEIVDLLIGMPGIKLDPPGNKRHTPLWCAALNRRIDVMDILLGTGKVDVNYLDSDDTTLLEFAVKGGRPDVAVAVLKDKRIRVNIRDKLGRTPLWWAVQVGQKEIAKALMNREDVDLNLRDVKGLFPLSDGVLPASFEVETIAEEEHPREWVEETSKGLSLPPNTGDYFHLPQKRRPIVPPQYMYTTLVEMGSKDVADKVESLQSFFAVP